MPETVKSHKTSRLARLRQFFSVSLNRLKRDSVSGYKLTGTGSTGGLWLERLIKMMKAVLKKWFPNTLNVVVFVFAFSFVSFYVCGAAIMCWHGTHYKSHRTNIR